MLQVGGRPGVEHHIFLLMAGVMTGAVVLGVAALYALAVELQKLAKDHLSIWFPVWAAAALAWNLSGGYAGQLSLGHAAFYGLGAYTSTLLFLKAGISPLIGMLAGAAISAAVAMVLGMITLRLKGSFFVMSTLAFGAVVILALMGIVLFWLVELVERVFFPWSSGADVAPPTG